MSRRKSIVGALAACALAFAGIGVANASAANVSAYECQNVGVENGSFEDSFCETSSLGGEFDTVQIGELINATLEAEGTSSLSAVIGGINFKIECSGMNNNAGFETNSSGTATGSSMILEYFFCSVAAPEPAKCHLKGTSSIVTESLKFSANMVSALETRVLFSPEVGSTVTSVTLEGCGTKAFNGTKLVTGSAEAFVTSSSPSRTRFTGTAGGGLKFSGQTAAFASTVHGTGPNGGTLAFETP